MSTKTIKQGNNEMIQTELSDDEISNLWLFLEGKSEGVLQTGGTFNFPVEFYKAIKELTKLKQLKNE